MVKAVEDPQSPRQMLTYYREKSPPGDKDLIKSLLLMPPSDRMEFLFYMQIHTNRALGNVVSALRRMNGETDPQGDTLNTPAGAVPAATTESPK